MTKFYTGVGSRGVGPDSEDYELLRNVATKLKACGWRLRSGHAAGADSAFEEGAFPNCDIYIPWNGFSDIREDGVVYKIPKKSIDAQLEKIGTRDSSSSRSSEPWS